MAFKGKKIRDLASLEKGLDNILEHLSEEEIKKAIGKTRDYISKCSNPDVNPNQPKRNIAHIDSVELDLACLRKKIAPPMLNAHTYILDAEKSKIQAPQGDVNKMMIKLTILDGKLKDEILKALEDNKLTKIEKDKINDAIKAIEDKILKIKLAINKDK